MKNYLRNWSIIRVLRLTLGIFVIIQGTIQQEWLLVILGVLFSLMPLINIGSCGITGCKAPVVRSNKKLKEIKYEEVH